MYKKKQHLNTIINPPSSNCQINQNDRLTVYKYIYSSCVKNKYINK